MSVTLSYLLCSQESGIYTVYLHSHTLDLNCCCHYVKKIFSIKNTLQTAIRIICARCFLQEFDLTIIPYRRVYVFTVFKFSLSRVKIKAVDMVMRDICFIS